jgi:hypothetical protein
MFSRPFRRRSWPGKKNPGCFTGTTLSCSKGITKPNRDHPVKALVDRRRRPLPRLQLPWSRRKLPRARPATASVIAAVAKVIGHVTAPKRTPVATEVGGPRAVARLGRPKRQSPVSRKGSMRMKKERARRRKRRTSSLTGSSRQGLTGGRT